MDWIFLSVAMHWALIQSTLCYILHIYTWGVEIYDFKSNNYVFVGLEIWGWQTFIIALPISSQPISLSLNGGLTIITYFFGFSLLHRLTIPVFQNSRHVRSVYHCCLNLVPICVFFPRPVKTKTLFLSYFYVGRHFRECIGGLLIKCSLEKVKTVLQHATDNQWLLQYYHHQLIACILINNIYSFSELI